MILDQYGSVLDLKEYILGIVQLYACSPVQFGYLLHFFRKIVIKAKLMDKLLIADILK